MAEAWEFKAWVLTQRDRDDPIGDLARDVEMDPACPMTPKAMRRHLLAQNACPGAIEALNRAIREWRPLGRGVTMA